MVKKNSELVMKQDLGETGTEIGTEKGLCLFKIWYGGSVKRNKNNVRIIMLLVHSFLSFLSLDGN